MTASPLLLWMPSLYSTAPRPSCAERLCPGVRRLWPGLPANMAAGGSLESACVPADLPYGPRECRAFMNDVEVFVRNAEKGQAGSGVLAALLQDSEAEKRLRRETDEVRRLLPGADKDREPIPAEPIACAPSSCSSGSGGSRAMSTRFRTLWSR